MVGLIPSFFLRLLIIIVMYIFLVSLFHRVTSRWLGMEKRKFFSHDTINDQHEKGDKLIGYLAVVTMIAGFIFHVMTNFEYEHWYSKPYSIIIFFFIARQFLKFYMERKWIGDKRESIYSLFEAVFHVMLFTALFSTDYWLY